VVFPRRRPPPNSVLLPQQEVEGFPVLPRPRLLVRCNIQSGSLQFGERLARRPCRLVVQLLHQEAVPWVVVEVQLVRLPHSPI